MEGECCMMKIFEDYLDRVTAADVETADIDIEPDASDTESTEVDPAKWQYLCVIQYIPSKVAGALIEQSLQYLPTRVKRVLDNYDVSANMPLMITSTETIAQSFEGLITYIAGNRRYQIGSYALRFAFNNHIERIEQLVMMIAQIAKISHLSEGLYTISFYPSTGDDWDNSKNRITTYQFQNISDALLRRKTTNLRKSMKEGEKMLEDLLYMGHIFYPDVPEDDMYWRCSKILKGYTPGLLRTFSVRDAARCILTENEREMILNSTVTAEQIRGAELFDIEFTLKNAYDGGLVSGLTSLEPEKTDNQGIATTRQELKQFFSIPRHPFDASMYNSYDKFILSMWFGPVPRKHQMLNDLTVIFKYHRPDDNGHSKESFFEMQRELERLLGGTIDTDKMEFFKTFKKSL